MVIIGAGGFTKEMIEIFVQRMTQLTLFFMTMYIPINMTCYLTALPF